MRCSPPDGMASSCCRLDAVEGGHEGSAACERGSWLCSMTKYQGQRRFGTEHALPISWISQESRERVNETFAYHTTTMANTLGIPVLVFTATGNMPALLSHYRPNSQIFAFTDNEVVRRRMALYHAVTALKCDFSQGSDAIINHALLVRNLLHPSLHLLRLLT